MEGREKELEDRLREVGSRLASPPSAVDELVPILDHAESLLSRVDQSPKQSMSNALWPSMRALVAKELLGHLDMDVKVAVASCLSEITRITAPEAPYDDDLMKELFQRIVQAFENLDDISSRSFSKRVSILETVAKVRSCVVMLDLECDSDILAMFHHFLKTIRPNHSEKVFSSMETIMTLVLEESEDISSELLQCLLDSVKIDNKDILPVVRRLGEKVISNCAGKLKPYLMELSQSSGTPLNEYGKVVASICQQNPDVLEHNVVNASGEIMADDSKQSERTVSDEMLQGSEDMEQEVGCTAEVTSTDKSPKPLMSNGNVQMGNGVSTVESSSSKQKSEPSPSDDQYKKATADNKDATDSGSVKESLPAEPEIPDATQPKRGRPSSKMAAKRHGGSAPVEQPASSLQEQSVMGDKALSLQKESDGTSDSGGIVDPTTVTISSEDKSQKQTSRKGSSSKIDYGDSSQKSRISKTKQVNLKAKNDKAGEPILKELISKSGTKVPNDQGNLEETAKTKSKKKLDHAKEELISKSPTEAPTDQGNSEETAKTKTKRKVDHIAKEELISKSPTEAPTDQGNSEETAKTKSKRKVDHIAKEELISKSPTEAPTDQGNSEETAKIKSKRKVDHIAKEISETSNKELDGSIIGRNIRVWWPMDKEFYNGVIDSYDHSSKKHKIVYNDGDVEILLLKKERWEFVKDDDGSGQEQAKDSGRPDASSEETKSKRAKTSSSSIPDEISTKTPAKSGTTSGNRRKGRPPKTVPANADDSPSSLSKVNEKPANLSREDAGSDTKLKDDPKSKGVFHKAKSPSKVESESKDNSSKKSMDGTPIPIPASRSKDNVASGKVTKDALKRKATEDSPRMGRKLKGSTTSKAGSDSKASTASEKGKIKVQESEKIKVRSDTTPKTVDGEEAKASAGKRRKRKG
ncbi:hypothetical protein Cni_G00827 [Canna indica]|uniref:Uncharacterized protein n=1 Tax=Canna indica TaxID=4628 RepID=A0AAQ3JLE7_9LILI|nr:hypothetical protein Cni_G00827 [Canna indica]